MIEEELDERRSRRCSRSSTRSRSRRPRSVRSTAPRLLDGREVAVKVQYPGVAAAVRADMQNLGLILRLRSGSRPGMDPQAIGEEIRERIEEELDYELEAQNQRTLARIFRGHPFIVIPDVVTSLSRERMMVSDEFVGAGLRGAQAPPAGGARPDRRDLFRFYFGCLYRHGQFSGDPHPGNSMLLDDGRMAFFDFGLFKRMPPRHGRARDRRRRAR